jgi:hypothetical protein
VTPQDDFPVLSMAGPWFEMPVTESLAPCPAKEPFHTTNYEFNHE